MSDLGKNMMKSGFVPLRDDGLGAIGFKPRMNSSEVVKPFVKIWFDRGQRIKDGEGKEVVLSVAAHSQFEYDECIQKGWKPIIAEVKNEQGAGSGATRSAADIRPTEAVGQGGAVVPGSGTEGNPSGRKGRPKKEK